MLLNAFSLNMLASNLCNVAVRPATLDEARLAARESAVGHADTARVFSSVLGTEVACERKTVVLRNGETAVVGQYKGSRLPEGATSLPDGATIEWLHISVFAPQKGDVRCPSCGGEGFVSRETADILYADAYHR